MSVGLELLWAALAAGAFAHIFRVRGPDLAFCAGGGALVWAVWLICLHLTASEPFAALVATTMATFWAELSALLRKKVTILFLVSVIMPLVPGGGMYRTMRSMLESSWDLSLELALATILNAGAMAAGAAFGASIVRILRGGRLRGRL